MSVRNESSHPAVRGTGREEAADQVLREFFRAAVPNPWPAWTAPEAEPAAVPMSRRSLFWGRWALAASVALLLGGQLWLASFYRPPEPAEAGTRSKQSVDVAGRPQVSHSDAEVGISTTGRQTTPRPVLKNMR